MVLVMVSGSGAKNLVVFSVIVVVLFHPLSS